MSGWHEGQGKLNQGEEYASIRVIITSVTTLGLELHGVQLRITHFRNGKGEYLSFSSLPRCSYGLPYWESFPSRIFKKYLSQHLKIKFLHKSPYLS